MNHPLLTELNRKEELDKFLTMKMNTMKEISNELGYNVNELLVLTKNHILSN